MTSVVTKKIDEALAELSSKAPQTALELMRGLTLRQTKGGIPIGRLHYSASRDRDPEVSPEWKAAERRVYTSQAHWDREQEIVDEAGGGERVWADVLVTNWDKIVIEDPAWQPDPEWVVSGGFDHGKTNPTALLRTYVDFDGNIIFAGEYYMPGKEVWQHAPAIKRMADFDRMEMIQADRTIFYNTLQQEQRPGHGPERAKSLADLYDEAGITNLVPFGGADVSDVSFASRLHLHWSDLEHRAPSVRIVCRKGLYTDKPQPGLYNWDCPNLLWELMVARRVKLTARQLLSRNTSEAIVDKDNHARDAMKYFVMNRPEPSRKSLERRLDARMQMVVQEAKRQGASDDEAATSALLQYTKFMREEAQEDDASQYYYGGSARRRIAMMSRGRGRFTR